MFLLLQMAGFVASNLTLKVDGFIAKLFFSYYWSETALLLILLLWCVVSVCLLFLFMGLDFSVA